MLLNCKLISLLAIIYFTIFQTVKTCTGFCVPLAMCQNHAGMKIVDSPARNNCTNGRYCCVKVMNLESQSRDVFNATGFSYQCIDNILDRVDLKSPNYSEFMAGGHVFYFQYNLNASITGITLEFLDVDISSKYFNPNCLDGDRILLLGFSNWTPDPICGNLTGFSNVIEVEKYQSSLNIILILSRPRFRWKIRITPIKTLQAKKTEICLNMRVTAWIQQLKLNRTVNSTKLNSDREGGFSRGNQENSAINISQPWIVELRVKPESRFALDANATKKCYGVILEDRHILTSYFCLLQNKINEYTTMVRFNDGKEKTNDILKIRFHFNRMNRSGFLLNNMAIIRTRQRISINSEVYPIQIGGYGTQQVKENTTFSISPGTSLSTRLLNLKLWPVQCNNTSLEISQFMSLNSKKFLEIIHTLRCFQGNFDDSGVSLIRESDFLLSTLEFPVIVGIQAIVPRCQPIMNSSKFLCTLAYADVNIYRKWIMTAISG